MEKLRPPLHVLQRFPKEHPLHQRFLRLPKDDPRRIEYDKHFSEEEEKE